MSIFEVVIAIALLTVPLLVGGTQAQSTTATKVDFEKDEIGKPPAGWIATQTGTGQARWTVVEDSGALGKSHVLKQSGVATFPVCVKEGTQLKDGFVEVQFKAEAGAEDRAGGVIWRTLNADNYYIARANALEDNVVLYKVEKGKRSALDIVGRKGGYGVKEEVASNAWHTLRVEFSGHRFQVIFNRKHLFDVEDTTFEQPGKVGLWTKADSVTLFDEFKYGGK